MNYYNRHIGDYARDTSHLSFAEDGAYNRMLDYYYTTERPLPLDRDTLYRKVRARTKADRETIDTLLTEFFEKREDGWHKNRCDEEIEKYQRKAAANRENGTRGGRPKKPNDNRTETQLVSKRNPNETLASSQEPRTSTPIPPALPGFDSFWVAWPKTVRKQSRGKCLALWRRKNFEDRAVEIVRHVESMKRSEDWLRGYDPAPLVYLNQERWDGAESASEKPLRVAL